MLGIIGKKLGMTQVFNEQGHQVPCTVVEAKPNPITKVISGADGRPFLEEGRAHAAGTTREQGRVAARGQGRCRGRTAHAPRVPAR
jgi:large subunit ribosomal protein L3